MLNDYSKYAVDNLILTCKDEKISSETATKTSSTKIVNYFLPLLWLVPIILIAHINVVLG